MGSFSGLGIGLSFLFGCVVLGLVAELYYVLWWKKKRITNREIEDQCNSNTSMLSDLFCWKKKPNSVVSSNRSAEELTDPAKIPDINDGREQDLELGADEDLLRKGHGEDSVEAELMRLHSLCGPPRFLFTIKEETKEDLESDDGKSRGDRSRKGSRTRSLSDLVMAIDTPFLTPLSSPTLRVHPLDSYNSRGLNPLFEASAEAEINRLKSSPPPKFKFLRDAEEKLIRRLVEEAEKRILRNGGMVQDSVVKEPPKSAASLTQEKDGSFVAFAVGKTEDKMLHHQMQQHHSASSQVLPLSSSPTTFSSK